MNLLIVEDERSLAKEISSYLSKENFLCDMAFTAMKLGKDAVTLRLCCLIWAFLITTLDLIKEARNNNIDVSFIIITARGAVEDKVRGLDLGADDYLSKPFALVELHSRIMAVARRKFKITSPDTTLGEFVFALQARKILHNGKEVEITKKEFDLLHYLVMNHDKVLARHQLYEHIWGNTLDDQYDSNFIDVHIKNLRKKLNACAPTPWLETVRGVGYRLSIDQ
jgi:DNA-binding response OmpR family regulator